MWIFGLLLAAFMAWIGYRISDRAGYPPAFGLALAVPILNILFLAFLAFSDWPVEGEQPPPFVR